jgi:hypothetical protein
MADGNDVEQVGLKQDVPSGLTGTSPAHHGRGDPEGSGED